MRLLGVENVDSLGPQHVSSLALLQTVSKLTLFSLLKVNTRMAEAQIYDGPSGLDSLRQAFKARL